MNYKCVLQQRDTCVFSLLLYFSHVVAHLKGREMFLLGSGTGFPFMSVFDIRDMLRPYELHDSLQEATFAHSRDPQQRSTAETNNSLA